MFLKFQESFSEFDRQKFILWMVPTKFSAQKMKPDPHKDISQVKFWWKGCKRRELEHFPGGTMDKNPPANAGDAGVSPSLGRFHMPRATKPRHHNYWACVSQLHSPLALMLTLTTEPASLEPVLHNKRSASHSVQLEKALGQRRRSSATKDSK